MLIGPLRQLSHFGNPVCSSKEQVRKFKSVLSQSQLTNRGLPHVPASMHRADGSCGKRLLRQRPQPGHVPRLQSAETPQYCA